jgi:hypothetical protein
MSCISKCQINVLGIKNYIHKPGLIFLAFVTSKQEQKYLLILVYLVFFIGKHICSICCVAVFLYILHLNVICSIIIHHQDKHKLKINMDLVSLELKMYYYVCLVGVLKL